jgi:hypothetical protein
MMANILSRGTVKATYNDPVYLMNSLFSIPVPEPKQDFTGSNHKDQDDNAPQKPAAASWHV